MSWFTEFVRIGASNAKAALKRPSGPRIDENLPYGIRIGSGLLFRGPRFTLARTVHHQVTKPDASRISAYGRIRYFNDYVLHRFYLADGENFLQVVTDKLNQIVEGETRLYRLVREFIPQSVEEWYVFIEDPSKPADYYRIGYQQFDLPDPADNAKTLFSYARMWPSPTDTSPQVKSVEFAERVNRDPYGSDTVNIAHYAMLYGRAIERPKTFQEGVNAPDEWLLLSRSDYPDNSALVTAHAGLVIDAGDFTVAPPQTA